ncbi:MAG: hypothetical protein NZ699_03915 [Roseiflexus sp.]|nr:hypothetical protein [Roseiflexus sp.]MCS7288260.1 hypothetical protein [Roseiflexus sp.]MDW8145882.1 hypothetical protein [Roseiflexaceae bacterium]MDW8232079.1 hypothetical protein [Roseiflexaceae bacterium]
MSGNGYRNNKSSFGIPPLYLYIAIGIAAVIVISIIGGLLSAGVQAYFAVAAGIMLVLANLRDLLRGVNSGIALMNTMIGAALIFFFLGSAFGWIWYIPALLLLVAAAPLGLRRRDVYNVYVDAARSMAVNIRRAVSGRTRLP